MKIVIIATAMISTIVKPLTGAWTNLSPCFLKHFNLCTVLGVVVNKVLTTVLKDKGLNYESY